MDKREGYIPPAGTAVTIHKNLQRWKAGNLAAWVITVKGKVVGYVERVVVDGARPNYIPSQWKRIQDKGSRKVYAQIKGTISADQGGSPHLLYAPESNPGGVKVRCNPKRRKEFHLETGEAFRSCARAEFPVGEPYFVALGVRAD